MPASPLSSLVRSLLVVVIGTALALSGRADDKDVPKEPPAKVEDKKEIDDKAPEKLPAPLPPPTRSTTRAVAALLPPVELLIGPSEGKATPTRTCSAFASGGNINVSQPNPTTIIVTMTGLAVARGGSVFKDTSACFHFDLGQCFEVVIHDKDVKGVKLSLEGKVLGRLRSYCECPCCCHKGGCAEITVPGSAVLSAGDVEVAAIHLPAHSICCCENETVYNHDGPLVVPATPGKYELHEQFGFCASAPAHFFVTGASADFTPEVFLDLSQFGFAEPFAGIANKDFGFTVTIKLVPDAPER